MKASGFKVIIMAIKRFGLKTIYFNLKYFPFKQAIRLPVYLSNKVYLRKLSGKIVLDCPVERGLIKIGFGNVGIFDDKMSRTIWEVSGTVIFKGRANFGHGSKISVGEEGELIIGKDFDITAESSIIATSKISIGDNCLFSWNIQIMDTDFHDILDNTGAVINCSKPVNIGNNVWICSNCIVLKGSDIPDNCVVGAMSLVNRALEDAGCVYAGNPIRLVKKDITWIDRNKKMTS